MLRKLLLVLAALALTSAQAQAVVIFIPIYVPPPTVPGAAKADYGRIHTVAIVSALGLKLRMRNYHFMGPKDHVQDITDWKLDEDVETQLKKYLGGHFAFKDIGYDRAALADIPNGKWDGLSPKFTGFMKSLPGDGIDAFLVVRPDLGFEAPGVEGIGLENGGAFGDMTPVLWENYEIDIVDARSGKEIASAYSRVALRDKTPPSFVGLFLSSRLKVGDDFTLDDVQQKILRQTAFFLLHVSLIETLRALDFGIDLPPPGSRVTAPFPEGKDPYADFKSVAVISGVGDALDLEHMGGTIFSRDSYAVAEPDWNLDTMLEERAKAALRERFEIKDAKVDRAQFARSQVWNDDGSPAPAFPGLAADPGIDLYVAFVKVPAQVMPALAIRGRGVGLYNKSLLGGQTGAFANYALVVLDAHTMKLMLARRALPSPAKPEDTPFQALDPDAWPDKAPALSAAQASHLRDVLTDLLTDSEDETLLRSGLTGRMITEEAPPAGGH